MSTRSTVCFGFIGSLLLLSALLFPTSRAFAASDTEVIFHDVLSANNVSINAAQRATQSRQTLHWHFSAMGRDYHAVLHRNQMAANASVYRFTTPPGSRRITTELPFLVSGSVAGDPDSTLRGVLDEDGFTGWLSTDGEHFLLQRSGSLALAGPDRLVMFRSGAVTGEVLLKEDARLPPMTDPLSPEAAQPTDPLQLWLDRTMREATRQTTPGQTLSGHRGVTRTLPIGIVIDSRYHQLHDDQGVAAAVAVLNIIDGIYQQELGVAIDVRTILLLDDPATDPLRELDNSIDDILSEFRKLRISTDTLSPQLALVHLFSGLHDADDLLGLAWIDSACRTDGYDVSVSLPYRFEVLLVAHEIAHNLGAVHDDALACTPTHNNIMAPRLTRATEHRFSSCSRTLMAPRVADHCLQDNIDLSVALTLDRTTAQAHELTLTVRNHDPHRVAPTFSTVIDFPFAIELTSVDARCRLQTSRLTCQHGSLTAGDRQDLPVQVSRGNQKDGDVRVALTPLGFSDINAVNNVATLSLPAATNAINNLPVTVQTNSVAPATASGTGLWLLLAMGGMVGLRWRGLRWRGHC